MPILQRICLAKVQIVDDFQTRNLRVTACSVSSLGIYEAANLQDSTSISEEHIKAECEMYETAM